MSLLSAVSQPATTVDEVLERMQAIDSALPADDGVAYFNRMYQKVTEEVLHAIGGTTFEQDGFLVQLDITFANLFFQAVADDSRGGDVAPAWMPLFENRTRPHTVPIQFALAGMNAHINHDLPVAVVATCRDLGLLPDDDTPACRDYNRTNEVLRDVEDRVKSWFSTGVIASIDEAMGKVDDGLAMWSIVKGRQIAWANAQMLWALADHPHLLAAYHKTIEQLVKFAGRGLLL